MPAIFKYNYAIRFYCYSFICCIAHVIHELDLEQEDELICYKQVRRQISLNHNAQDIITLYVNYYLFTYI